MRVPFLCQKLCITSMIVLSIGAIGCGKPPQVREVGKQTNIGLPPSDPFVLSKALEGKIVVGMKQEAALAILQEAATSIPSARSSIEAVVQESKSNTERYDLTITQGKRKLVLNFKDDKLVTVAAEGLQ